jgi:hypothetical protein
LGGGGGSLKSGDQGGDTGISGKRLERGGGNNVIDDGWEFDDGFGTLPSVDGVLQGDVKGARGGNSHKGGKN